MKWSKEKKPIAIAVNESYEWALIEPSTSWLTYILSQANETDSRCFLQ